MRQILLCAALATSLALLSGCTLSKTKADTAEDAPGKAAYHKIDHSSQFCGFLEEVLTCAPYISILYCFEIGQKIALGKKFING